MGIQGLHKGLSFATKKTTLRDFSGQTLAIDSSSWLHRSVYSISEKYVEALERGQLDKQCVRVSAHYVTSRCRELLDAFRIAKVYLVMDGKRCPLKADTNEERERRRQANLTEAREYQKRGRRDKAEEKYKACIKVKDDFTIAVMTEVRRHFANDARVQLVWSPYEADAQLTKLCVDGAAHGVITEDSDVLVYSAAAHCAFPIIFKLDRQTGTCDVISMDWLLSYDESQPCPSTKASSALETLLWNLASRQFRRPGFGVRLFVQGCVLAGCDYAPNKLTGVGLVNAFKYVRDNAFRDDSIRFAKVLDAIPKKNKINVDINDYELILAKSEAVFYYHLVRYPNKSVKPLCEPKLSETQKDAPHCIQDHSPLMERFADDWSFLGQIQESPDTKKGNIDMSPPLREIVISDSKSRHKLPAMFATGRRTQPTRNPYAKSNLNESRKRQRDDGKNPLNTRDGNQDRPLNNFFAKFARDANEGKNLDPRFVKRSFPPPEKIAANSEWQKTTSTDQPLTKLHQNRIPVMQEPQAPPASPFEYDLVPDQENLHGTSEPSSDGCGALLSSASQAPTFFDLTDSNSETFPINLDGVNMDDEAIYTTKAARVSLDNSVDFHRDAFHVNPDPAHEQEHDQFHLPEPSPHFGDENGSTVDVIESTPVTKRSKYFSTVGNLPEPDDVSTHFVVGDPTMHETTFTPQAKPSLLESDEIIDSPDEWKRNPSSTGTSTSQKAMLTNRLSSSLQKYSQAPSNRPPRSEPLIHSFNKQCEGTSVPSSISQSRPWVRSFRPLAKKQSTKNDATTITIKSFFPSVKGRSSNFNQLRYNNDPTDEDFLWNGS